ncbi:hypothetical protein GCM10027162_74070 [Streptomyces incanus]
MGTVTLTIGSERAALARDSGTGFGDRRTESLRPVPGVPSAGTGMVRTVRPGPQGTDLRMFRAGGVSVPDRETRRSTIGGACSRGP